MLRSLIFLTLAAAVRGLVSLSHQQLSLFIEDCDQYNATQAAEAAVGAVAGAGTAAGAARATEATAAAAAVAQAAAAPEFGDPVCGADGVTYANARLLRCLNARRPRHERVRALYPGPCDPAFNGLEGGGAGGGAGGGESGDAEVGAPRCPYRPLYEPVCASDNVTYANADALACRAALLDAGLSIRHEGACSCPEPCARAQERGGQQEAVCASNGLTYANVEQVLCLKKYQKELDVLHDGPCVEAEARRAAASRRVACVLARARHEWRPFCGADGRTYPNLFVMHCFRPGACGSAEAARCVAVARDPDGLQADASARVCGSDGRTYPSHDHLACAAATNKHLFVRHAGACGEDDDPCATRPLLAGTGAPVCGSDGRSYVTPGALWCAARSSPTGLKYVHDGPCLHARIRGCLRS